MKFIPGAAGTAKLSPKACVQGDTTPSTESTKMLRSGSAASNGLGSGEVSTGHESEDALRVERRIHRPSQHCSPDNVNFPHNRKDSSYPTSSVQVSRFFFTWAMNWSATAPSMRR